jgi:hypothetical protein
MKPLKFILASFSNEPGGASARKLTAFAFMLCVAWVHLKWVNHENAIAALVIDVSAALLSLSIVTAENLIRLRHGGKGGAE